MAIDMNHKMLCIWMYKGNLYLYIQDEIFHIPQAQNYCQGDWLSWDPKITTFPGLYIVSAGLYRILRFVVDSGIVFAAAPEGGTCTVDFLRAVNLVMGTACVPVLFSILSSMYPDRDLFRRSMMV